MAWVGWYCTDLSPTPPSLGEDVWGAAPKYLLESTAMFPLALGQMPSIRVSDEPSGDKVRGYGPQ